MNTKKLEDVLIGTSNKSTAGKVWTITKILSIFGWNTRKFIAKNTPTVLGVAWEIKKEQKELEMEDKIKMLSHTGVKKWVLKNYLMMQ